MSVSETCPAGGVLAGGPRRCLHLAVHAVTLAYGAFWLIVGLGKMADPSAAFADVVGLSGNLGGPGAFGVASAAIRGSIAAEVAIGCLIGLRCDVRIGLRGSRVLLALYLGFLLLKLAIDGPGATCACLSGEASPLGRAVARNVALACLATFLIRADSAMRAAEGRAPRLVPPGRDGGEP